jgi:kynureninase
MMDFTKTKGQFYLPDGMIYLDGNSLGPLPIAATERVSQMMTAEWGEMLIGGWNKAGWMAKSTGLADRIGQLVGAPKGTMILGDTLSVKVYQALASALELRPNRRVILSDNGNFPSDLYIAQGLIASLGSDYELRVVDPEAVADAITDDVAVLMLTEVDYKTGRRHDMKALTTKAHAVGAIAMWDLAHSAGAVDVDLAGANADFAVGCTYKFLNGGPGAPAFIYVADRLIEEVRPAMSGWLGHQAPFDFDLEYHPHQKIDRMRVGTPPAIAMAALEAALEIWDGVSMAEVRAESIALADYYIDAVEALDLGLTTITPRNGGDRGSQVSFSHENAFAITQALIDAKVVGDFRAPIVLRFGITPLYIDRGDLDEAVSRLAEILTSGSWDQPQFHARSFVT